MKSDRGECLLGRTLVRSVDHTWKLSWLAPTPPILPLCKFWVFDVDIVIVMNERASPPPPSSVSCPPSFPRSPLLCKATECSDLIPSLLMLCQESDIPWSLLRNPMNSWIRPSSLFPLVSPSFLFIMLFLHHCILFTTLKNACVSVYHSSQFRFSVAWKAEAERENRYVFYTLYYPCIVGLTLRKVWHKI